MPVSSATAQLTANVNKTQSVTLIRNFMRLNISQILHHRGSFPESCFTTRQFGDQNVVVLGGESANDPAKTLMGWLEHGVFEALGQGYLEKAVLCMSSGRAGSGKWNTYPPPA
jgi:hypothetical protein